eukprot:1141499-Pelagomonas_calceolata.AAC.3
MELRVVHFTVGISFFPRYISPTGRHSDVSKGLAGAQGTASSPPGPHFSVLISCMYIWTHSACNAFGCVVIIGCLGFRRMSY